MLSLYVEGLTFGQAEYVVQGVLFVVFCLLMRNFRFSYLFAFLSCVIYGLALDLWRLIPLFNPSIVSPENMKLWLRIFLFVVGELLTAFSVALYFRSYFPPQVNDYFVKGVSTRYGIKTSIFKTGFDVASLIAALIMSLCFFGRIEGIGWGTLIITVINGALIGFFSSLLNKGFDSAEFFPKLKNFFEK